MFNQLPISQYLPQVSDYLSQHNNLVLQAEPGAGKSTALPLSLLNEAWLENKTIIMLEPRRLAAKSIAYYLAKQLGEQVGQTVGYQIKNDRKISSHTKLEIVTEGILTRRIQNDPELSTIGLIIFDEFHERSLHGDLALLLALEIQASLRDELRLLVMSATIDTDKIASYLTHAKIIKCPGRQFPVEVNYLSDDKHYLSQFVIKALYKAFALKDQGDILIFLPGQAEIKNCLSQAQEHFSDHNNWLFLPLYGALSIAQQEQVLTKESPNQRRIIFTTNIAETSLTIDGITCVIDSGLEKIALYDPVSNMTRLVTQYISKASAEQRKGRAGRLQNGHCIRLWSASKHQSLTEFQQEEIRIADLSNLLLELFVWGQTDFQTINWLTPPPKANFDTAKQLLLSLGLIGNSNQVTKLGNSITTLGLEPRLATMVLKAKQGIAQDIACLLATLLSTTDIFYGNQGADIIERLLALTDYQVNKRQAINNLPIKDKLVEQVISSTKSLRKTLKLPISTAKMSLSELQVHVGPLLLIAYPERLAKQRHDNSHRYQLANGRGVFLHQQDSLFNTPWLVVSDCNAQKQEGLIFNAAPITKQAIEQSLDDSITIETQYRLDDKKQKIIGRRIYKYLAITTKTDIIVDIPKAEFQHCLSTLLKTEGLTLLNWTEKCNLWLARASWLAKQLTNFPDISKNSLLNDINTWCLPYLTKVTSLSQLKKVNIFELLTATLSWDDQQVLAQQAPTHYTTPSNKDVIITYDKNQGPTVSVVLQEMFGELTSPHIGGGRVALRFELLSPARRPVQTTSDLANFWQTSYFDVAKEMRAKYPKHRWPEKPLLEKAGRSIKRKKPRPY